MTPGLVTTEILKLYPYSDIVCQVFLTVTTPHLCVKSMETGDQSIANNYLSEYSK